MRNRVLLPLCTTGSLLAMACSPGDSAGREWSGTIDTLENGAILIHNPSEGTWTPDSTWHLQRDFRIGSVEGAGPATFSQIIGLAVDSQGRIYVLDRLSQDVRVFDSDGDYVRTLGRKGEGPGEFGTATGLGWGPSGHLWVVDQGLKRFTLFDTSGAFVDTRRAPMRLRSWEWSGAFTAAGELYDWSLVGAGDDSRPVLLRFDLASEYSDTFPMPEYRQEFFEWRTERGGGMMTVPFTPQLVWTIGLAGRLWSGVSDRYRVHRAEIGGDTTLVIEREFEPVPVSANERAAAIEKTREFMGTRQFAQERIPSHKPVFERLAVDDLGYLWVRMSDTDGHPGSQFDVFSPEGRFLGSVRTAESVAPYPQFLVRGDMIYYVVTDELDVPFVEASRIVGR